MNIEQGDYFVVTRGVEFNAPEFASILFGGAPAATDAKPRYDRSWDGLVFRAEEVAASMVAARVVAATASYKADYVGRVLSLNLAEIEVMTVTARYAELCKEPPDDAHARQAGRETHTGD